MTFFMMGSNGARALETDVAHLHFGLYYNERVGGVLDTVSFLTLAAEFSTC